MGVTPPWTNRRRHLTRTIRHSIRSTRSDAYHPCTSSTASAYEPDLRRLRTNGVALDVESQVATSRTLPARVVEDELPPRSPPAVSGSKTKRGHDGRSVDAREDGNDGCDRKRTSRLRRKLRRYHSTSGSVILHYIDTH